MVTWDMVPPMDQNGVITMYEVLYEPLETFNGAIMSNTTTVDGMTLTAVLEGLKEFVDYTKPTPVQGRGLTVIVS